MSVKYECAICANKVGIRNDVCYKCATQFREMYGDDWQKLDWIKALTQNKHYMERLEREEQYGWDDVGTSYTQNHYYLREEDSYADINGRHLIDTGTGNHYIVQKTYLKSHKYDTEISKYIRQGLNAKAIHAALVERYGDTVPSHHTICKRVRHFTGSSAKRESHAKHYTLLSPSGEVVDVFNLAEFCRKNNLSKSSMNKMVTGERPYGQGWSLVRKD